MENNESLGDGDLKINDMAEFRRENTKVNRRGIHIPMYVSKLTMKLKGELSQNELEELHDVAPMYRRENRVELDKRERYSIFQAIKLELMERAQIHEAEKSMHATVMSNLNPETCVGGYDVYSEVTEPEDVAKLSYGHLSCVRSKWTL